MPARIVLGDHLRSREGELVHVPVHQRAGCNCIVYSEAVMVLVRVKKCLVTLLTIKWKLLQYGPDCFHSEFFCPMLSSLYLDINRVGLLPKYHAKAKEVTPCLFSPRHFQTGLRVYFGKNTIPTFLQNWNPWSRAIPFVTFCWHRGNDVISELPEHMQLDPFQESLISAITDCHNALQEGVAQESLEIVQNEPIMIEVYCGISPIVHNYSIWGFNRDRGKFGF